MTRHVDTCVGRIVLPAPRERPGPREQIAELREAVAVLDAENRSLRERVERLERQFDAAAVPLPAVLQESE